MDRIALYQKGAEAFQTFLASLEPVDCPLGDLAALILSLPPGEERERLSDIRWLRIMARAEGCPEAGIRPLLGLDGNGRP